MNRRSFILSSSLLGMTSANSIKSFVESAKSNPDSEAKMPVIFIGHGAPMYALGDNKYAKAWKEMGEQLPTPKAVVSISAHWLTRGSTKVTAIPKPKMIYDFGGMDPALYEMKYPAPGNPELAQEISTKVNMAQIELDHQWGYDHGTWCVLYHMFPKADIPVIQLSIDYRRDADYHFELARELDFLRKKGVLVFASGNIVHNLRSIVWQEEATYDWAVEFDELSKKLIDNRNFDALINYRKLGKSADLSIPTPDHYFPLMYALGLAQDSDSITYPIDGISYGSTSMRSVLIN